VPADPMPAATKENDMTDEQKITTPPPTREVYDDYRVVVDVPLPRWGDDTHDRMVRECSKMVAEIRRHTECEGSVVARWRHTTVCKLCGDTWEVDANGYPWCCNAAQTWADANAIKPAEEP
jgi:hypothetical protein